MKTRNKTTRLILLEANEINFDIVKLYTEQEPGKYPMLEKLMGYHQLRTISEEKYHELEPWIQWVSVHTGKTYDEHRIFRLGDVVGSCAEQIFEVLEKSGIKVGSISAMNAENKLERPAYFIPDPWTNTKSDDSFWSKLLSKAISQTVNDNAQGKITPTSFVALLLGFIRFAKVRHYGIYFNLAISSVNAQWRKALFLDLLIHDIHTGLHAIKLPGFSTVFINAGAHIQHHYLFNSKPIKSSLKIKNPDWYVNEDIDPFAEMLYIYDKIIGDYLVLKNSEFILCTGLSQKPYDRVKYYYRLKDHAAFLLKIGINFLNVTPRMTRDFLVEFSSIEDAAESEKTLRDVTVSSDGMPFFGLIDNRGKSLFLTLTYPNEINHENDSIVVGGSTYKILNDIAFVAIKNGMHQGDGFAYFSPGVSLYAPPDKSHVKEIFNTIKCFFLSSNETVGG